MARKKTGQPKMTATDAPKLTSQARLELPTEEFDRLRAVARRRGLSVSAFIRMAVLKEMQRIEEGRD